MHAPSVFGRAEQRAKRTFRANEHGAERLRYESGPSRHRRKASRGNRSLRWETTEHECSSWYGFEVQKSIGRTADRDARGR